MNIAITVDGDSLATPVAAQFESCRSLLIVNFETREVTVIPNPAEPEDATGERLARAVLQYDCEAVITGLIGTTSFNVVADRGVTRFLGTGYDGAEALELMDKNRLPLIRDANGGEGCGGTHHH